MYKSIYGDHGAHGAHGPGPTPRPHPGPTAPSPACKPYVNMDGPLCMFVRHGTHLWPWTGHCERIPGMHILHIQYHCVTWEHHTYKTNKHGWCIQYPGVYANCVNMQRTHTTTGARRAPCVFCCIFQQFAYTPGTGIHQPFSYFVLGPNPVVVYINGVPVYTFYM